MYSLLRQQGVTLAVALVMLLLLTIIGVTAMKTTIFQEKMGINTKNRGAAFEAAESVLVEAENWVLGLATEPTPTATCSTYPCIISYDATRYLEANDGTWWSGNASLFSNTLPGINTQPRYVVEFSRFVPDDPTVGFGVTPGTNYYRVTARGTGTNDDAQIVIRTTVAKRF